MNKETTIKMLHSLLAERVILTPLFIIIFLVTLKAKI